MQVIQVDRVRAHAFQRSIKATPELGGAEAVRVGRELAGHHSRPAVVADGQAQGLLRASARVDLGGIEETRTGIEGGRLRGLQPDLIDRPATPPVGTDTEARHGHARSSQPALRPRSSHNATLRSRAWSMPTPEHSTHRPRLSSRTRPDPCHRVQQGEPGRQGTPSGAAPTAVDATRCTSPAASRGHGSPAGGRVSGVEGWLRTTIGSHVMGEGQRLVRFQ